MAPSLDSPALVSKFTPAFQRLQKTRFRRSMSMATSLASENFSQEPSPTHTPRVRQRCSSIVFNSLGHVKVLSRLQVENARTPHQDSASFLIARVERNVLLDEATQSTEIPLKDETSKQGVNETEVAISPGRLSRLSGPDEELGIDEEKDSMFPLEQDSSRIDWEFWGMVIDDYPSVALKLPHLMASRVRQGLPPKLRGLIWQAMSQSSATHVETLYGQLLADSSPYEHTIQRDLARTYPHVEMFKQDGGPGQTALLNVLKAYSLYDPYVGYCQGLGFLVGPLLMNMPEQQGFSVFVRLMETYDMRTLFTLSMDGLQMRLWQLNRLLEEDLPKLYAHFERHAITTTMYASQWFLSLFAYSYPLDLVLRIYDVVFAEGAPETIMRVAMALLRKNEERLLYLDEFEDILEYLTGRLFDTYGREADGVICDAIELSNVITKARLDKLAEEYLATEDMPKRNGAKVANSPSSERLGLGIDTTVGLKHRGSGRRSVASLQSTLTATSSNSSLSITGSAALSTPSPHTSLENTNSSRSPPTVLSTASDESTQLAPSMPCVSTPSPNDHTEILHQQIEDLVRALSELHVELARVTEELATAKAETEKVAHENQLLTARLSELEGREEAGGTDEADLKEHHQKGEGKKDGLKELKEENKRLKEEVFKLQQQPQPHSKDNRPRDASASSKSVATTAKVAEMRNEGAKKRKNLGLIKGKPSIHSDPTQTVPHKSPTKTQCAPRRPTSVASPRSSTAGSVEANTASAAHRGVMSQKRRDAARPTSSPTLHREEPRTPSPPLAARNADAPPPEDKSDLQKQCRELERMLAEAKLRIAELETCASGRSSAAASPNLGVSASFCGGAEKHSQANGVEAGSLGRAGRRIMAGESRKRSQSGTLSTTISSLMGWRGSIGR
ncbi:uncharacterized protein VTP21DRAFT_1820 [Calcarisporiella thermophila]|uniref:uncharacterized protein n=1 Tax=Calcarisporiella thermophila TaxID=911321 RepID=UPI0037425907